MSQEICPNCNSPIKDNIFGTNKKLISTVVDVINAANGTNSSGYCNKCGDELFLTSLSKLRSDIRKLRYQLASSQQIMPIVTIHNPLGWEYEVLGVVTAQSVTGTGIFSEVSMSVSDLLGKESESMNNKIKDAENICLARLRQEATIMGGNAIVGLNLTYAEMGSLRGMIMICCTGTAVNVTNAAHIGYYKQATSDSETAAKKLEQLLLICEPHELD